MTGIQWTDETWNPSVGCSRVSPGCEHCYAERVASRGLRPEHQGLTRSTSRGPVWTGEVRCLPERLETPLRWRKPRRVFVDSMSDLFHEAVPDKFIDAVWAVMNLASDHTFQVLTKRPERMRAYLDARVRKGRILPDRLSAIIKAGDAIPQRILPWEKRKGRYRLDPPNVWLGTSVEDQERADERIPHLLATPAAVRFLSVEPMLGPVELTAHRVCDQCGATPFNLFSNDPLATRPPSSRYDAFQCPLHWWPGSGCDGKLEHRLDWIIVGGESGPGARPCHVEWIRDVVRQCREACVPVFVKQVGSQACERIGGPYWSLDDPKGGDPDEWPEDLRVREWPA